MYPSNKETTSTQPTGGLLFSFAKPKQQPSIFNKASIDPKACLFTNKPFQKPKPQLFSDQQSHPLLKCLSPQYSLSPTVSRAQYQKLQKDLNLQKQTTQHFLKRVKELELINTKLQNENKLILERTVKYQTQLKRMYQEEKKRGLTLLTTTNNVQPKNIFENLQPHQRQNIITSPLNIKFPIQFKYTNLPQNKLQVSIFDQNKQFPTYYIQKIFDTLDNYKFQVYIAMNSFDRIKYIILQKVQNHHGSLTLNDNRAQQLFKNYTTNNLWYMFHQNSSRNAISKLFINEFQQKILQQKDQKSNIPLKINFTFSKYLTINQSAVEVYHPDWKWEGIGLEFQFFNFYNYKHVLKNQQKRIKQGVEKLYQLIKNTKTDFLKPIVALDQTNGCLSVHYPSKNQ